MVAPVAVWAQSWAETMRPATAEVKLTSSAHQNIAPAERARLRPATAGAMAAAIAEVTSPIIALGRVMAKLPKITSALGTVLMMAASPLAPRLAWAFIILSGCNPVGPQSNDFVFPPVDLFQTSDQDRPNATSLAINDA